MFRPTLFGKYLLTHRLAVGGMAEIFKARVYGVGGFEKVLVVKQILPQYATYREFVDMFIDEAKITVSLNHGNIVPVYELGRIEGYYFIAMECVHGRDLAQVLLRSRELEQPMEPEQAVAISIDVLKGLHYAHRCKDRQGRPMGIVHRDVSPQNIMVSWDGEVKLLDFGIAKAAQKLSQTHPGAVRGKFSYLSPEMARGEAVDHRTDIFSAGIVLWEALTGQRLFTGGNEADVLRKIEAAQVEPPSLVRPKVPEALDPIVLTALARDPAERYKDAATFQLALSKFLYSSRQAVTSESIGEYMREIFAEQIAKEMAAEQDPKHVEEVQRLYDELAEKMKGQATDAGKAPSRRPKKGRRQATQPGIGLEPRAPTPTRPLTDRRRAEGTPGPRTGATSRSGIVTGRVSTEGRGTGEVTASRTGELGRTAVSDPNLELDDLLAEMGPGEAVVPPPAPAAAPETSLEYEVFASREDDEAGIFDKADRGRPLGWILVVIVLLAFGGYLLYSQTGLFHKDANPAARKPKPAPYTASITVRVQPEKIRDPGGRERYARLFWHQGDSPVTLRDLPVDQEQELRIEMNGYRVHRLTIPPGAWQLRDGMAPTAANAWQRRLTISLKSGSGPPLHQTLAPLPGRKAKGGSHKNQTGQIQLDTRPAGARVWLFVGSGFSGENLDPRQPHRFMAILPGRGRRVLTLRPFRSPNQPGDWTLGSGSSHTVRFKGEINFDEDD